MECYKEAFLSSDPYELKIEENLKEMVKKVIDTHIPCKIIIFLG